ncbi:MAG: iron-containing alcohol dehydrogenase [Candidatus Caldatribacterium sp.]|nr:iron-containing alcohol dehydrogenase [Candidatus Caldatribacterium sp.]
MELSYMVWYIPTRIVFGKGVAAQIGEYVREFGNTCFLVIDPALDNKGLGEEIASLLKEKGIGVVKYSDIPPNPPCSCVDRASEIARQEGCNVVVGVGGGSTIDVAKGVAVVAKNAGECWDYVKRRETGQRTIVDTLPIIAVPSTAGTGSEVTPYAVFTNPLVREKGTIVSDKIFPKVALVDPTLTVSMPPRLTASTGVDAFAHAIESYINVKSNYYSELIALEAMKLIFWALPVAFSNGIDESARSKMLWASTLAGIAIANVGPCLPHALGQAVGGLTGAAHGETVAACLPEVLAFTFIAIIEKLGRVAETIEPSFRSLPLWTRAERALELVRNLLRCIGLELRFRDLGLKESDIEGVANAALKAYFWDIEAHPRRVGKDDILKICKDCY